MRSVFRTLVVAACVVGCSHAAQESSGAPRPDRTMLTQEQFARYHFNTVYDAVVTLRSNWLKGRGPDSFTSPSQVRVYLDNVLLGDVSTLEALPMRNVVYLKHFDGASASARWGLDHGAGVIYVSTRPPSSDPKTNR